MYSSGKFFDADHDRRRGVRVRAAPCRRTARGRSRLPREIANAALAALLVCFLITTPPSRDCPSARTLGREPLGRLSPSATQVTLPTLPPTAPSRRATHPARPRADSSPGSTIMSPSPPPPANAAIGAVATTVTAAIRMPVKISGSGERELDLPQDLAARHPHPPRRLDDVPVDAVDARRRRWSGSARVASTASATMLFTNPIPSTVRKTPIRTRLGSARPTIDVPIANAGAAVHVAEDRPRPAARSASASPSAARRELELLDRLREQEARVVADEPDRVDERAGAAGRGGSRSSSATRVQAPGGGRRAPRRRRARARPRERRRRRSRS